MEGIPGKVKYINITDNIIISLPILSEVLMCIFLSPAVSLGHFDPNVQADIWLKEKEPRAGDKRMVPLQNLNVDPSLPLLAVRQEW